MERLEMWDEPHFYFCLNHRVVEDNENRCRSDQRLGPFPTRTAAESALEITRQRTADWDAEEREERGED